MHRNVLKFAVRVAAAERLALGGAESREVQGMTPTLRAISHRAIRPFLDRGFRTVGEQYADYNLGNVAISLESSQLGLQFVSEKGQYSVEVRSLADSEWFDEHTVLTFIGAHEAAEKLIEEKRSSPEGAVSAIDQNFEAIATAFSDERYSMTKQGLNVIERENATRRFGYQAPPN